MLGSSTGDSKKKVKLSQRECARKPFFEPGGRFEYFLFFLLGGRGEGESKVPGVGRFVFFFIENPRRGGRGAGKVSAGTFFWGGELNIFFRAEMPASESFL